MGNRRLARELALQILFELEYQGKLQLELTMQRMLHQKEASDETRDFLKTLLQTYFQNDVTVDESLEKHSENWKLHRMGSIDRNLLRLGVTEILYFKDVPKSVTINEYLEIAKKFGTQDSSGFINGILDKIEKKIS